MAVTVGLNSWVTIAEADAYLTSRAGAAEWFALDDSPVNPGEDSKETFLITAFYWLLDDPGFGLSAALTDDYVKRAQIEAALFLSKYREDFENREAKQAGGVERFKNSKWEEDLGLVSKPQVVLNILGSGGSSAQNDIVQLYGDDFT